MTAPWDKKTKQPPKAAHAAAGVSAKSVIADLDKMLLPMREWPNWMLAYVANEVDLIRTVRTCADEAARLRDIAKRAAKGDKDADAEVYLDPL